MFFNDFIFNEKVDNIKDLFNSKDGFLCGNMFKDEFDPYKNYRIANLSAHDEKEKLLLLIYENDFALNDLSLYLDLHPEDEQIYKLYKVYTEKENKLVEEYERKYGPLSLTESNYDSYMWYKGKWPFEGVDL